MIQVIFKKDTSAFLVKLSELSDGSDSEVPESGDEDEDEEAEDESACDELSDVLFLPPTPRSFSTKKLKIERRRNA